jgi:hypothetical protein
MDKHLQTQVTTIVKMKMEELMDQPETSLKIQQQVDQIIEERLQQYNQQRQQKTEEELEATTQRMTQQLQWIEMAAGTSIQLLETKRDLSVQGIDISMTLHKNVLEAKQNEGVQSVSITLSEAIIDMDENRKIIKVDIADTVEEAIENIKKSHKEIQDLIKDEILKAQDTIQETVQNGMECIQNNTAKEEGIHTISVKIDRGKCKIQGRTNTSNCSLMRKEEAYNRFKRKCMRQCSALRRRRPRPLPTFKPKDMITTRRIQPPHHYLENTPRTNGDTHHNNGRKTHICKTHMQNSNHPSRYGIQDDPPLKQPLEDQNNANQMRSQHQFQERVTQRDQEYQANKFRNAANASTTRYTTLKKPIWNTLSHPTIPHKKKSRRSSGMLLLKCGHATCPSYPLKT